jgi:hypothetical protein
MARELGVAPTTLMRQASRLGRHCLLYHERHRPRGPLGEPLVVDGFRTFEFGHYWPCDLNLAVGRSHFVYAFNDAELRRSGSMRPGQRAKRARLESCYGRPNPRATQHAVFELVSRVVPPGTAVELHSDEHPAYPRAFRQLPDREIQHHTTPSTKARTPRNPLFPVNLADMLIRHSSANHKRETIAFSKRRQGLLYRIAVWAVWRNYMKPISERRGGPTPAQMLEIRQEPLLIRQLFARRLFPSQIPLPGRLKSYYYGRVRTRRIGPATEHRCRYAT